MFHYINYHGFNPSISKFKDSIFSGEDVTVPELSDEFADLPDIDRDIFEYCIGAICRKFKLAREESAPQNQWIETKGHGKLVQPAPSVVEAFRKCDNIFYSFHGKELRQCNDPIGSVQKIIMKKYPSLEPKAVRYFIRMKFFARIRKMNAELRLKKAKRGVRHFKQSAQFSN